LFRFRFYSSHCIYRTRLRAYQHIAFTVLDRYDMLFGGHKSDAGVGLGRRCLFFRLIWISLLHNVVKCVRNRIARFRC